MRVMSFSYVALQRMQRLAPRLPLVMLIDKARHWPMLKSVVDDAWMLGPGIDALTKHPKFAAKMAQDRTRPPRLDRQHRRSSSTCAGRSGVRAVITDRPRAVLGWLDGVPAS